MARIDPVRPGANWPNECVPGAQDWQRFDVNQWRNVSGDLGGSYSPSKPIVIGGSGLSSSVSGTLMSGGVYTATGGRVVIAASAGDFPQLSPPRARTIMVPLSECFLPNDITGSGSLITRVFNDQTGWGIQANGGNIVLGIPGRYLHIGAQLRRAAIDYRIQLRPTVVPSGLMALAWFGSDDSGSVVQWGQPSVFPIGGSDMSQWIATHTYAAGSYVYPVSQPFGSVLWMKTTGGGTTGSSEPTWPIVVGGTVVDGSVTWTAGGDAGIAFGAATVERYFSNGQPQQVGIDFDGSGTGMFQNFIQSGVRYAFLLENIDNNALFTSLALDFDSVESMAFE
jgi:hypothetical protein